jgi:putative ABC transport system substrate-binding protein
MRDIRRREIIALIAGAASWPLAARAQQPAMPVIGILGSVSPAPYAGFIEAIKQGLREAGYVEGRNIAIEYRWAEGQYDRLPQQALELVDRGVAVIILVGGGATIAAAKAATATIPIVFVMGDDPVKSGAVAALNRPGGNATGVSLLTVAMEAKRLQLLHELVPNVSLVAIIVNQNNPQAAEQLQALQAAARTLGVEIEAFKAGSPSEIDSAPAEMPVQQAVKVELVINLQTAKTLGLTIPLPLLGRADEVIE